MIEGKLRTVVTKNDTDFIQTLRSSKTYDTILLITHIYKPKPYYQYQI